jgi:hypothetical protein
MAKAKVEIFSKEQFEAALPKLKGTDVPAWTCAGLVEGEYVYLVTLGDNKPAKVLVRSSVDKTGFSRASGEDSIRIFVCDKNLKPLSGKANRWTTRLPGWQDRMNDLIRFLAGMAVKIGTCPRCEAHGLVRLNKVKKEGPNKGRWFVSCKEDKCFFEWQTQRDNDDDAPTTPKGDEGLPECPGCEKPTLKLLTVKKEGPNTGRKFYKCQDEACAYFQWADEES